MDEGQDFLPEWWRAVRQLLEDDGEAYFVIDEAQDLYENKEKWTDNAMENSGFSGRPSLLKAHTGFLNPTSLSFKISWKFINLNLIQMLIY